MAAKILGARAMPSDIEALTQAQKRELDHYVLAAIDRALKEAGKLNDESPQGPAPSVELDWTSEPHARALREVSTMLVHELQDVVGFARLEIAREVPDVETSRAAAAITRISSLLDAIELLGSLGADVDVIRLDLSALVIDISKREEDLLGRLISLGGPQSVDVSASNALIDLVLAKGIDNADESMRIAGDTGGIVINWGRTDRNAWLAVIDRGVGLPPGLDVFGFAKSSKEGHLGVGLTLARRAMTAMSGTLSLEPNAGGGATLRATWPQRS